VGLGSPACRSGLTIGDPGRASVQRGLDFFENHMSEGPALERDSGPAGLALGYLRHLAA